MSGWPVSWQADARSSKTMNEDRNWHDGSETLPQESNALSEPHRLSIPHHQRQRGPHSRRRTTRSIGS